jgi:dihydropteroate synthase
MAALVTAGLPEDRIVIDPGIGFGKTLEHNLAILRNIDRFFALGRPVYMGLSNKSLWGDLLDLPKDERGSATQVATALLAARGVGIHRVHDVGACRKTLRIVQAMNPS